MEISKTENTEISLCFNILIWNNIICKILMLQSHTRSVDGSVTDIIEKMKSGISDA